MNNLDSNDEAVDTPLVSPFPLSNNDSDDEEVLNELIEYENARTLRRERIINSFDRDDLAFECMIGFRKFTAYLDPFLPMNIISRKAYNTIMVEGLEGTGKNLVAIVKDVYVFVGSFTYITDFVVLEDIGEFIMSDMAEVLMGRPFRKITKLKYDVAKGLVSFTKIFDTYTYRMPRTIPRLKNFNWSKVPPLLELSQNDLMNGLRHPHEKNKFMYKNCLNLGPEYQVNESMKEWLIHGHVSIHEVTGASEKSATIVLTLVSRAKVIENQVMAISTISISLDPSEESVGTSSGQVFCFGRIPTTVLATTPTRIPTVSPIVPQSPDYTRKSLNYSPASNTEPDPSKDPSSDHIPPLPATSSFLSLADDSLDSDTPDTPPSPTYRYHPV
ncbi:hypothetical protein Tco_1237634 [Tanacetum coccineum]